MPAEITLPLGLKLSSDYAVYCREDDILAIADLHLGYEASLQSQHVTIPRFQIESIKERLIRLVNNYKPGKILINGDMKHEFGRNIGQEWDEVESIISVLEEQATLIIVRGNHDNFLQTILAKRGVEMIDSYPTSSGNIEFIHGHEAKGPSNRFIIYAHEHPVIRLRDEIGARVTLPCFLFDELNRFLILPAFSPLASGTNVLSPVDTFMIRDLHGLDTSTAQVYAISDDGIMDFGSLGELKRLDEPNIR